ncbi:MAG: hypothetical protein LC100_11830 [Chitinophagales bacterium]|nr:hypothetical protein [Chitinophagales bacterium]
MKKILLFVVAIPITMKLHAQQDIGLPFITNYSPLQTSNYANTWAIQQAQNGVMYFGSHAPSKSIVEYDGVNWRMVPGGGKVVRGMAIDSSGTVFYGGDDLGYISHDNSGSTICISLQKYLPAKYQNNRDQISTILAIGKGVYFRSGNLVFRFTKKVSGKDITWNCQTWKAKTSFKSIFHIDSTLYILEGNKELYKLVGDSLQLTQIHIPKEISYLSGALPFRDSSGKKFYLFRTTLNGLYLFDGRQFTPFHTEADKWIKKENLRSIAKVNGDDFALSIIGIGVVIINSEGKILQVINRKAGLVTNVVWSLYWDGHHSLWIGLDNTICKVALNTPFTRFFNQPGLTSTVKSMAKIPDGTLYAGTNNGVAKYNKISGLFESIPSLPGNQVFNLVPDGNGLLVGDNGIYNLQGNKNILIYPGMEAVRMMISKKYPDLLYVSTLSGNLEVFYRDKSRPGGWGYEGKVSNNSIEQKRIFTETPDGKLLGVGRQGNPYIITFPIEKNGKPVLSKPMTKQFQMEKPFNEPVYPFYFNKRIFFLSIDSSSYTLNEDIQKLVKDTFLLESGDTLKWFNIGVNGVYWLYSQAGNYDYYTSTVTGVRYRVDTSYRALVRDYGGDNTFTYCGDDGIFWISALDGLIRFDTKMAVYDSLPFNVLIRRITTGNTIINPIDSLASRSVKIQFDRNSLRFDYAAPYFTHENHTQYQTFLEGFEKKWSAWGNNTYKEYTNLPSGHYTFHVRARNVFGANSREATFSLDILPPWYNTWWAYVLYTISLVGIIWLMVYLRSRQLRQKNLVLEEKVSQRTDELKQSLEHLKSTQKQLIQSEKMASLGELTAGIAHEIQNPLNFVNNFSDINTELISEADQEIDKGNVTEAKAILNDIKENSQKINHHGKRADAIVKGMLQHSRTSTGQKELTDINALCDEYLRLAYHGMRAKDKSFNCELKTEFDSSLPKINVVPQDIGRVLLNLINNAFFATNEKFKKNISGYQPTVIVTTKILGDKVEISVKDNGNGIPEKIKDKIFQPFFTTKPTGQGTGLGLSLSYDIVKAHGGEIKLNSKEGEGTAFIIQLPKS